MNDAQPENKLQLFTKDKFFIWSTGISLSIEFGLLGFLFFVWPKLPPVVPLYYSLPWGEEQLSPTIGLAGVILGVFVFYLINTLAAFLILNRSKFLAHLLLCAATLMTLLTAITTIQIILLVT